jgi:hypothetical protein
VLPVTWYDGQRHRPKRAELGLPKGYKLPSSGSVLIGEAGTMVIPHWDVPRLFPEDKFYEFEMPHLGDVNHYTGWVDACLGDGTTTSNFEYAGPLTEAVLLGAVAVRFPGERLQWNSRTASFTNNSRANCYLTKPYRAGWC